MEITKQATDWSLFSALSWVKTQLKTKSKSIQCLSSIQTNLLNFFLNNQKTK